jgi:hypothetical protein
MKLKKTFIALGAVSMLIGASDVANAAIIVDNWTVDLAAIGNLGAGGDNWTGYGVYGTNGTMGVNQLAFQSLYHTIIAGPIAPGTLQNTDTLGVITQAVNQAGLVGATTTGALLNNTNLGNPPTSLKTFELTFATTTTQQLISIDPITGIVTTSHLGVGAGPNGVVSNGMLNIYADICTGSGNGDGSLCANTSTTTGGAGMQDGLLIASFAVVDAGGLGTGSFNNAPSALDGQDDASFVMTYNYGGIIQNSLGNPLAPGATLAFTASNTDADNDNNQKIDTVPSGWGTRGLGACGTTTTNNCGVENGTVNLQAVPEPATLALVGAAMVGLGISRRRVSRR